MSLGERDWPSRWRLAPSMRIDPIVSYGDEIRTRFLAMEGERACLSLHLSAARGARAGGGRVGTRPAHFERCRDRVRVRAGEQKTKTSVLPGEPQEAGG